MKRHIVTMRLGLILLAVEAFAAAGAAQEAESADSANAEIGAADEERTGETGDRSAAESLAGPDATLNLLAEDDGEEAKGWSAWKVRVKERFHLDFGLDYVALGFAATESLGEDTAASASFRVFGTWELLGRGTKNSGGIVFKIENRHAYTDVTPREFGPEVGYAGLLSVVMGDQGWRATHLFWHQQFADGRGVGYVGWLDTTDYLDVYALASPWQGFSNVAFATGSGTIGGAPDGAFGAMLSGFVSKNLYLIVGLADANADASDPFGGVETFFDEFETLKSVEFGWTAADENSPTIFLDHAHITVWQIDAREEAGTPSGWGASFSLVDTIGTHWIPFLRGGWARDGGSVYEGSISAGLAYSHKPGRDMLGIGLNWNRPNPSTFGGDFDSQFTIEVFEHLQLTQVIELTPSVQYLKNPALADEYDSTWVFGLRFRAAF